MLNNLMHNEPPALPGRGFIRLRIDLSYDGTMFAGWASQPKLRAVQSEVEKALQIAFHLKNPVNTIVGGRTDAGVHARGQVIHADVPESVLEEDFGKIKYSLNGLLDADVRILDLVNAPYGFDARFAAIARTYSYSFSNGAPDPLYRNFVVPAWRKLDVEAMNKASEKLLGLNDFTAFCKRTQYGTSIRTLNQFDWRHTDFGVMATLEADAFCYSMVRSIVGCLLPVGEGRRDIDYPKQVLDSEVRHDDIVTMPAHGLVLENISYAADDELMARQEITRARRENTEVET